MSNYISKRFDSLEAYVPGEQPTDMKYIKLNTNESPFPPSDGVLKAIADEAETLNLYPDPECGEAVKAIGGYYNVGSDNVLLGNGSDEILSFCFMTFCDDKKGMSFPEISYGFYEVYAALYGVDGEKIPLKSDFSINISDYFNCKNNIVIANPNAPTGIALEPDEIEQILKSNPDNVVIIDEAYVDFGAKSCLPLVDKYDNLIVVGTYSKSRSMAGARIGFAIAQKPLIDDLKKIKYSVNPYNINRLSLVAAKAAIDDNEYYKEKCKTVIANREYTKCELEKLGFCVLPSKANFVFAKCNTTDGGELYRKLKDRGILVRHFKNEKIKDFVRITIGTREQMDSLISAVKNII